MFCGATTKLAAGHDMKSMARTYNFFGWRKGGKKERTKWNNYFTQNTLSGKQVQTQTIYIYIYIYQVHCTHLCTLKSVQFWKCINETLVSSQFSLYIILSYWFLWVFFKERQRWLLRYIIFFGIKEKCGKVALICIERHCSWNNQPLYGYMYTTDYIWARIRKSGMICKTLFFSNIAAIRLIFLENDPKVSDNIDIIWN